MYNSKTVDFHVFKKEMNNLENIKKVIINKSNVDEFMLKWRSIEEACLTIREVIHYLNLNDYNYSYNFEQSNIVIYK